MKNKAICALVTGIMLGTGATGMAAEANPHEAVPNTDWSYQAVRQLVDDGLVSGCSDADFLNLKPTRYDLAVFTAQAISKNEDANAKSKSAMRKLMREYKHELHVLGVEEDAIPAEPIKTVQKTKAEEQLNRFNIYGWGRIRYDHTLPHHSDSTMALPAGYDTGYKPRATTDAHFNMDFCYNYRLNDNLYFEGESEFNRPLNKGDGHWYSRMAKMYLRTNYKGVDIFAGRYYPNNALSFAYDEKVNGVMLQWGKKWRYTVDIGRTEGSDSNEFWNSARYTAENNFSGTDLNGNDFKTYYKYYTPTVFSIRMHGMWGHTTWGGIGFYHVSRGTPAQCQDQHRAVNYLVAGMGSGLGGKLGSYYTVTYSDAEALYYPWLKGHKPTQHLGYQLQLNYGTSDMKKPHSWAVSLMYRHSPMLASYSNTGDWWKNQEGWRISGEYVPEQNFLVNTYYTRARDIDTHSYDNTFRIQANWMF